MMNETVKKILISATTALLLTACMGDESTDPVAGGAAGQQQQGTDGNTSTGGTDGNTSTGGTDGNTSTGGTDGNTSTGGTDGNTSTGGTDGNTSTDTLTIDNKVTALAEGCQDPFRQPTTHELIASAEDIIALNLPATDFGLAGSDGWTIGADGTVRLAARANDYGTSSDNTVCVQGTLPAVTVTRDEATGEVTASNGVVWKDNDTAGTGDYTAAEALCTDTWRLPTVAELDSIYDRENKKMIDGFTHTVSAGTWSSDAYDDDNQYVVYFQTDGDLTGEVAGVVKTDDTVKILCVKN